MKRLINRVAGEGERGRLAKAFTALVGGTALGQLLPVLISPLLARLFAPEEIGVLGAFALLLTFLSPVACGRYDLSIPVAKDSREALEALAAALVFTTGMSFVVGGAMVFAGPWVAEAIGRPSAGRSFLLLPVSLWMVGVYQALNYWAIREREYTLTAKTKLVQGVSLGVAQVIAGFLRSGQLGLILADLVGRTAGQATLARQVWKRDKAELLSLRWAGVRATARRFRDYPFYAAPAALIHAAAMALPGLILGGIYGVHILGLFFFGFRYIWTPVSTVGLSLAQMFTGEGATLAKTDPGRLQRSYWGLVKRSAIFGAVVFGLIALFGRPVFEFVFGAGYAEAGTYAQVLAAGWYVQFVVGPVFPILNVLERQKWVLAGDALGICLIAGTFWGAAVGEWPVLTTLGLYSASVCVMYGALLWMGGRAVADHVRKQPEQSLASEEMGGSDEP